MEGFMKEYVYMTFLIVLTATGLVLIDDAVTGGHIVSTILSML